MSRIHTFGAIWLCLGGLVSQRTAAAPVVVTLLPNAVVSTQVVKTSDIAGVVGGDVLTRQRIANLDISERENAEIGIVTKSQVALRLRLAGIPTDHYRITGPALVMIRWSSTSKESGRSITAHPRGDQPIVEMAQAALAALWQVPTDDVDVRLARPLPISMRKLLENDSRITLKPFLAKSATPGAMRLSFGAYRDATLVQRSVVMIDARLYRQVAITTREISAREVLSSEDVRLERRPIEGRVARQATTDVVGKVTTHAIRKGAVLLAGDVRDVVASTSLRNPVIKRGDRVRLVARGNGLKVSMRSCESLENGRVGETIRIRNLNSKKVVTGRVVRSGEVEIAL